MLLERKLETIAPSFFSLNIRTIYVHCTRKNKQMLAEMKFLNIFSFMFEKFL